MPRNALLSLTRYHQAALEEAMAHLVTAPLENVPALQATAQVHQGVIQALNAGA